MLWMFVLLLLLSLPSPTLTHSLFRYDFFYRAERLETMLLFHYSTTSSLVVYGQPCFMSNFHDPIFHSHPLLSILLSGFVPSLTISFFLKKKPKNLLSLIFYVSSRFLSPCFALPCFACLLAVPQRLREQFSIQ